MNIIMLFVICGICQCFFPWWSLAFGALLIGFWSSQNGLHAFKEGFLGVGILWIVVATIKYYNGSDIIAVRIHTLLGMPSPLLLIIVTGCLGGILGSFATLTGYQLRTTLQS